ncbi:ATP-binding protein [Cohnella zeiphila]|uniref:ATP-binding protein n=1 Tax=Cohnella zeiphila TaxID=2761120 RepID=A0A7X0VZG6_9BACL|nr:ATP-binding protein [Cohnella zeiphila]MBB6733973.1 ATP-binding protein [Cohnella zeiphila]
MRERPDLFNLRPNRRIGLVNKVDSCRVNVSTTDERQLRRANVNGYVILHTADANARLIGRIARVVRFEADPGKNEDARGFGTVLNDVTIHALGTLKGPGGGREQAVFTRAVESLPEIGAQCFLLLGEDLAQFVALVAEGSARHGAPLSLGTYALADEPETEAWLDGNAFFQRHALIVGSTGSGKSWAVAALMEQVAELASANAILFDLHGEYEPLAKHPRVTRYRIAGPADLERPGDSALFLPYWLLGYEDMLALILDRSDENAPNQAMAFSQAVVHAKRASLSAAGMAEELDTFTIDSPVPYRLDDAVAEIAELNEQKVPGKNGPVNGPFYGRFNRFLPRLDAKRSDRRLGFLFALPEAALSSSYLDVLAEKLMRAGSAERAGVKIVDFSEVPSDILPMVIGLTARLVFQLQMWSDRRHRRPIALICEEAHLYLPHRAAADAAEARALDPFGRIAKEGRKYGVSLLVVSQRPSELNPAVASQCHNVVALRLAHSADKSAVSRLLPENQGGIEDLLATLGVGEAVVVGDACPLPSRIRLREPAYAPESPSVRFWDEWSRAANEQNLALTVRNLRRQTASRADAQA